MFILFSRDIYNVESGGEKLDLKESVILKIQKAIDSLY